MQFCWQHRMAKLKLMDCFTLLIVCLYMLTVNVSAGNQTLKKDLHDDKVSVDEVIKLPENELHHVVPDKNIKEEPAAAHEQITTTKNEQQSFAVEKQQKLSTVPQAEPTISPKDRFSHVVEETKYKTKDVNLDYEDDDLPGSYITGFYIFIGLSMCAMLFIVVRVYRLRLSRAERRYGVQGDRSTHELVPLPVSIEDDNSEDEDHTLFEVNRQQIRIL